MRRRVERENREVEWLLLVEAEEANGGDHGVVDDWTAEEATGR